MFKIQKPPFYAAGPRRFFTTRWRASGPTDAAKCSTSGPGDSRSLLRGRIGRRLLACMGSRESPCSAAWPGARLPVSERERSRHTRHTKRALPSGISRRRSWRRRATLKVGIACPSGCDLTGTRNRRLQRDRKESRRWKPGSAPGRPRPHSTGRSLEVAAPEPKANHSWSLQATAPLDQARGRPEPSHGHASIVRFVASRPPEHRVTLEVIDKGSGFRSRESSCGWQVQGRHQRSRGSRA